MAEWTAKFIDDLPDSAFLHIEAGGERDADGRTKLRSLRHFPVRNPQGRVDLPHLRNALARIPQSKLPDDVRVSATRKAEKLLKQTHKERGLVMATHAFISQQSDFAIISDVALNDAGANHQLFEVELIRIGNFYKDSTKQPIRVDAEMIDNWTVEFADMRAGGVKVPVAELHVDQDDSNALVDPSKNRGYVEAIFRDGNSLMAYVDLIGDDAIELATRNDVSIFAEPGYVDGNGRKYLFPIRHVAITPTPVIPGQTGFVKIAASQDGAQSADAVVFMQDEESHNDEDPDMEIKEFINGVAKPLKLELAEDVTAEALTAAVTARVVELSEPPSELTAELETAKTTISELKGAAAKTITLDEDQRGAMEETVDVHLERLIESGHITPAAAKLARPLLCDGAFMLSRRATDRDQSRAREWIAVFEENEPVPMGAHSGAQSLVLARAAEEQADRDKTVAADVEARAAKVYPPKTA